MPYNSIRCPERARQNQTLRHAAVAHLVERHLAKVEVASSSLVGRSISEIWFQAAGLHLVQALQANQVGSFLCGPVVQLVRTLACHARGRQFEPDPGRSSKVLRFIWQSCEQDRRDERQTFSSSPQTFASQIFAGTPIQETDSGECRDKCTFYASVAQSVEQGTENPRVIGSIPIGGTTCFAVSG